MKKRIYIAPVVEVHTLEAENMMALSAVDGSASNKYDVLVNEREDDYTDIWGN